jgi:hypothetical protein
MRDVVASSQLVVKVNEGVAGPEALIVLGSIQRL